MAAKMILCLEPRIRPKVKRQSPDGRLMEKVRSSHPDFVYYPKWSEIADGSTNSHDIRTSFCSFSYSA